MLWADLVAPRRTGSRVWLETRHRRAVARGAGVGRERARRLVLAVGCPSRRPGRVR
ncbi:hypothetical protein G5V59_04805 [Nocardioides sp. W3-2-3]|nr:hypothetical protein [Nocardioides convexus]